MISSWGVCVGYFGDEDLRRAARAACLAAYGERFIHGFDSNYLRALRIRRGNKDHHDPEPESRLDYTGSADPALDHEWTWEPREDDKALWMFNSKGTCGEGWVISASAKGARVIDTELRLLTPGASEVELKFRAPTEARAVPLNVEISHVSSTRDCLPYQGIAAIDVRINGTRLEQQNLNRNEGHSVSVSVLPERLRHTSDGGAAEQTLSIRLLPESTTTYWLKTVQISLHE